MFGDYDVDGVTTAALLASFLRAAGAHVEVAVARRDAGYGFTPDAAADFARRACTLVITGDCGTSDSRGDPTPRPRSASRSSSSITTPCRRRAPSIRRARWSIRSARTRRFRFAAWRRSGWRSTSRRRCGPSCATADGFAAGPSRTCASCSISVALGTIADLVPLTAENRILTALGLRRLQSRARPGVAALLAAAGVDPDRDVDARTVAWKLAPRINAPGRLGAAEPSLELLLADAETAEARAAGSNRRTPSAARSRSA